MVCGQDYNIGGGLENSISLLQCLKLLKKISNKDLNLIFKNERQGDQKIYISDISKINSQLNWKPTITLEDGIREVTENINYWKNSPLWTPKKIKLATTDWFKFLKD